MESRPKTGESRFEKADQYEISALACEIERSRKRPPSRVALRRGRLLSVGALGGRFTCCGGIADFDPLRVAPETLERIERPGLGCEHMNDEGEEVHQDPLGAIVAFD